ncbi:hypothetical protein FKM82_019803, partial [Ascaphus truei]
HSVSCRYFLWRFLLLSYTLDFCRESYNWPLLVYMMLICLYPFTSSLAHTFSSMSTHARHICYFLDYGALSLYSLGCAFTYGAYVMPDRWVNSTLHRYFVPVAAFNTFICTGLSCYSRYVAASRRWLSKIMRTSAFRAPILFDNIPLIYRSSPLLGDDCSWNEAGRPAPLPPPISSVTGFLFASHLPERLAPGRCYIGHSHQLFTSALCWHSLTDGACPLVTDPLRKVWLSLTPRRDPLQHRGGGCGHFLAGGRAGNILLICFLLPLPTVVPAR